MFTSRRHVANELEIEFLPACFAKRVRYRLNSRFLEMNPIDAAAAKMTHVMSTDFLNLYLVEEVTKPKGR